MGAFIERRDDLTSEELKDLLIGKYETINYIYAAGLLFDPKHWKVPNVGETYNYIFDNTFFFALTTEALELAKSEGYGFDKKVCSSLNLSQEEKEMILNSETLTQDDIEAVAGGSMIDDLLSYLKFPKEEDLIWRMTETEVFCTVKDGLIYKCTPADTEDGDCEIYSEWIVVE